VGLQEQMKTSDECPSSLVILDSGISMSASSTFIGDSSRRGSFSVLLDLIEVDTKGEQECTAVALKGASQDISLPSF